jgi:hypothetical protein
MDDCQEGRGASAVGPHDSPRFRKRRLEIVGALLLFIAALIGTAPHPSTQAQASTTGSPATRMVAVTPFADEVGFHEDLAAWASTRLALLLSREGIPVVPFPQVERALREAGFGSSVLLSLAATDDLAQRVGADIVVSGRLVRAETEWDGSDTLAVRMGPGESTVTLALRARDVRSRRLTYAEVTGRAGGGPARLVRATESALEDFVARWATTVP